MYRFNKTANESFKKKSPNDKINELYRLINKIQPEYTLDGNDELCRNQLIKIIKEIGVICRDIYDGMPFLNKSSK